MLKEIDGHDVENIIRQTIIAINEKILDVLHRFFFLINGGSQTVAIQLKSHLEEDGYACWMETGQMGGGDKRFAKVVICCITTAYVQSDNYLCEVHLRISTEKPLIPLQIEKQFWSP